MTTPSSPLTYRGTLGRPSSTPPNRSLILNNTPSPTHINNNHIGGAYAAHASPDITRNADYPPRMADAILPSKMHSSMSMLAINEQRELRREDFATSAFPNNIVHSTFNGYNGAIPTVKNNLLNGHVNGLPNGLQKGLNVPTSLSQSNLNNNAACLNQDRQRYLMSSEV